MTYQEFNHIYFLFTKNKKGIRHNDKISTTGDELKTFVEFAMNKISKDKNQFEMDF